MMNRRLPQSTAKFAATIRFVVAPVAMLAAWGGFSSSAAASCGDYVTLGHDGAHGMHSQSGHLGRGEIPPCQGPECQRRAPSPLPPDLPLRSMMVDAWAGLRLSADELIPPAALLLEATLLFEPAFATRIDRPPKAIL